VLSGLDARILGKVRTLIALALIALLGVRAAAEQPTATKNPCAEPGNRSPRLFPADEASSRPEFFQYRTRLLVAIEQRDVEAVLEAVDPRIRLGFDASGGVNALRELLGPHAEAWEELRMVLAGGGSFTSPVSFAAPYVYAEWPEALDSFACAAVVGTNVRLRQAPRLDAPIITAVSHAIVRVVDEVEGRLWTRVQLGDGRSGYVWHAYVRRPTDYRALFNLIDGRWRMTAWVSGD
jgi:hypothetical protein